MNNHETPLFENLESYKDLFDHAHDLIHIVYPDGTIMYVNKAWETNLGYTEEEVRGHSVYSLVVPEEREEFIRYRQAMVNGKQEDTRVIVRFRSKSGTDITVEGFVSARNQNGTTMYTRGIFRDISVRLENERKLLKANEALKESEKHFKQLLINAPDAVIVINSESIITVWNPRAVELFGWTEAEAIGKNLTYMIIPPQYREAHTKGMNRFLSTGIAHVMNRTMELTALNKNGNEFYISLTISSTQQQGKSAFIAFIRNIDQEKRNEIELENKRMALLQSNEELEQFAHVASHDMKEPVRKIRLFSHQLKTEAGEKLSERALHFLERIETAAMRLTKMIEGVLAHSSVHAGSPLHEPVDLDEIIRQVLGDLELIIEQKNARVHFSGMPRIEGAPFLLYQLFYNLVSNSLKFSRPDVSPVIQLEARQVTDAASGHHSIAITVTDNGIGFSNEHARHIFKKFSRLNAADQFEGTGLGLALCKAIVEKHHGSISASGMEGGGAVFTILLPVEDENQERA